MCGGVHGEGQVGGECMGRGRWGGSACRWGEGQAEGGGRVHGGGKGQGEGGECMQVG